MEKNVKMAKAEVVHLDPAEHVSHPPEAHDEDRRHEQETHEQPEEIARVTGLEGIEVDPVEDVGEGDQRDRTADRHHQDPDRRVGKGDPLVGPRILGLGGRPGDAVARVGTHLPRLALSLVGVRR